MNDEPKVFHHHHHHHHHQHQQQQQQQQQQKTTNCHTSPFCTHPPGKHWESNIFWATGKRCFLYCFYLMGIKVATFLFSRQMFLASSFRPVPCITGTFQPVQNLVFGGACRTISKSSWKSELQKRKTCRRKRDEMFKARWWFFSNPKWQQMRPSNLTMMSYFSKEWWKTGENICKK